MTYLGVVASEPGSVGDDPGVVVGPPVAGVFLRKCY